MKSIETLRLEGLKFVTLSAYEDERGFFKESYRRPLYEKMGISCEFVQDNHSFSKKGTIRGMHFQSEPGQAKLISVLHGTIYDVVVDIRPHSPTFGEWIGIRLEAEKHQQLFIPIGFAHGFCTLSEEAHVAYKVSSVYDPTTEKGFRFNDPELAIQWPIKDPIVSERDRSSPFFREAVK